MATHPALQQVSLEFTLPPFSLLRVSRTACRNDHHHDLNVSSTVFCTRRTVFLEQGTHKGPGPPRGGFVTPPVSYPDRDLPFAIRLSEPITTRFGRPTCKKHVAPFLCLAESPSCSHAFPPPTTFSFLSSSPFPLSLGPQDALLQSPRREGSRQGDACSYKLASFGKAARELQVARSPSHRSRRQAGQEGWEPLALPRRIPSHGHDLRRVSSIFLHLELARFDRSSLFLLRFSSAPCSPLLPRVTPFGPLRRSSSTREESLRSPSQRGSSAPSQ